MHEFSGWNFTEYTLNLLSVLEVYPKQFVTVVVIHFLRSERQRSVSIDGSMTELVCTGIELLLLVWFAVDEMGLVLCFVRIVTYNEHRIIRDFGFGKFAWELRSGVGVDGVDGDTERARLC